MPLPLPIQMFDSSSNVPSYAHEGDAGLDLHATAALVLKPFERALVPCGFALAIPKGYAGLVIPRSGLAARHGITVVNAPGLIDSGYRGEIKVVLMNLDPSESFEVHVGDRIAQLMLVEVPEVTPVIVESLDDTQRGAGGFGSSGLSS